MNFIVITSDNKKCILKFCEKNLTNDWILKHEKTGRKFMFSPSINRLMEILPYRKFKLIDKGTKMVKVD